MVISDLGHLESIGLESAGLESAEKRPTDAALLRGGWRGGSRSLALVNKSVIVQAIGIGAAGSYGGSVVVSNNNATGQVNILTLGGWTPTR
jgi:hypothetical protein